MPAVIQAVTFLVPSRYFLAALRAIVLKGAGFGAIWKQFLGLAVFAGLALAVSATRLGKGEAEKAPRRGRRP
jgi:ABC-2 type transport system permease protein